MKYLVLALILAAGSVNAATITVTLNTTARMDLQIEAARLDRNARTCTMYRLAAGCTDAQVVTAGGPAGSIAADAAGLAKLWLADRFAQVQQDVQLNSRVAVRQAMEAATAVQRNSVCTTLGLPSGCWP